MFWFDKKNPNVEFCDNRTVARHEYYPHRYIEINPDTVCDFTSLPFKDKSFKDILKAIKAEPLFGNRSGKHNNTHWMAFMKFPKEEEN